VETGEQDRACRDANQCSAEEHVTGPDDALDRQGKRHAREDGRDLAELRRGALQQRMT
jgi:hypothetical protein